MTGRVDQGASKSPDQTAFDSTLLFRLLRAGTTGGAPLSPLEVEYKPQWQPYERCTRVWARSSSRELWIGTPLRNDLPLGWRAGSFHLESSTRKSDQGEAGL